MKDITVLAIETSCDETSVAVVKNGREVLANTISTQIPLHEQYGGVVPEIASRMHVEKINLVIKEALKTAIAAADGKAKEIYTEESWKVFCAALAEPSQALAGLP